MSEPRVYEEGCLSLGITVHVRAQRCRYAYNLIGDLMRYEAEEPSRRLFAA